MGKGKKSEGTLIGDNKEMPQTVEKTDIVPYAKESWAKGFLQEYNFEDDVVDVDAPEVPEEIKALVDAEITPDFPPTFFFEKPGDFLRGVYAGRKEQVGPNASMVHLIECGTGSEKIKVGIWGKTSIDLKLEKVELGQKVFIQLMGLKPGKFSTDWYNFKVLTLK